jgi:hypothetical protein
MASRAQKITLHSLINNYCRRAQEEAAMAEGQREFHLAQQAAVLRMANKGADPAYNGNVRFTNIYLSLIFEYQE